LPEDDEYELLPKQQVEALRKEIEKLKKNPLGEIKEGESLLDSINELNTNIRRLIDIFARTGSDLDKDYTEANPMLDLKSIKEQNEDIAHGLVAVADMMKDVKDSVRQVKDAQDSNQPITPGPKIPMARPSAAPDFGTPPSAPQFQGKDFPDEFSEQIPPPPQPMGFDSQPPGSQGFSRDKRRRGLFGRR